MTPKNGEESRFQAGNDLIDEIRNLLDALDEGSEDPQVIESLWQATDGFKKVMQEVGPNILAEGGYLVRAVVDRIYRGKLKLNAPLIAVLRDGVDALETYCWMIREKGADSPSGELEKVLNSLKRYSGIEVRSEEAASPVELPRREAIFAVSVDFREEVFPSNPDPIFVLDAVDELGELLSCEPNLEGLAEAERRGKVKKSLVLRLVLRTREDRTAVETALAGSVEPGALRIRDITTHFQEGVDTSLAEQKLGEILVDDLLATEEEVDDALSAHRRVGDLIVEAGVTDRERVNEIVKRQERARGLKKSRSISVDTDKLEKLNDLIGELVLGVAQAKLLVGDTDRDMNSKILALEALEQISRDLQEQVMVVRMVPLADTLQMIERKARKQAAELGKKIRLSISGAETELDKKVAEHMAAPLEELVRNAVQHGMEAPEYRLAAGKDEVGTIGLRAYRETGSLVLEVSDDGRGLTEDELTILAGEDAGRNSSGFGILLKSDGGTGDEKEGLWEVSQSVGELRGKVEVHSEAGVGTTVRISLPPTMAIIEGMAVRVGSEILTIPLLSITEQIRPKPGQVKTVEGQGEVVDVRGEYLPLVRLHELFGLDEAITDPCEALLVVLENEGRKYTVMVDDVLGQQQAVIKSLETNFKKVAGTAGATILGDGRISLILDVSGVERMAFH